MQKHYLYPQWPAPDNVCALTTLRAGGFSQAPYTSFNFGHHVNDDPIAVKKNINLLCKELNLKTPPTWLTQVHGTDVIHIENYPQDSYPEADASYTQQKQQICAVLTADCVPILVCDKNGTEIAAIHAGWQGLLAGVIDPAIQIFKNSAENLFAWLGPAIGPRAFVVGEDVRQRFIAKNPDYTDAFQTAGVQQWHGNLYQIARINLQALGVNHIYGGNFCTYTDKKRFFSYRRNQVTGRMASLIWLK